MGLYLRRTWILYVMLVQALAALGAATAAWAQNEPAAAALPVPEVKGDTTAAGSAASTQTAPQQDLSGEIKEMRWVGFRYSAQTSRIFVRTTEPVTYRVEQLRPELVEIVLENTRIPLVNNTRFLDTRYFDTPVLFIEPKVIEGPSPSVRIEIQLRRGAQFTQEQNDNQLAVDFLNE